MAVITYAQAKALLKYDPETGSITWLPRPREMFPNDLQYRSWNTRFAGKEAFTSIGGHGYRQGTFLGNVVLAHRMIWLLIAGSFPESVDHINGDRLDNRLANLRAVSLHENNRNRPMRANNTSGVTGVTWSKRYQKWHVSIRTEGRCKFLGFFTDLKKAKAVRLAAQEKYGYHRNHGKARSSLAPKRRSNATSGGR